MAAAPFIIVGLGNPGAEYAQTRHNAGFWFVDKLAVGVQFKLQKKLHGQILQTQVEGSDVLLCKPSGFMNNSGQCVRALLDWYKIDIAGSVRSLLVVHDELDLPPGEVRLKLGGGHGGHNGLRSINQHLGSNEYLRLRIGVGHPGLAAMVTDWLIHQRINNQQRELIDEACVRAESILPLLIAGELERAMNHLHTRQ